MASVERAKSLRQMKIAPTSVPRTLDPRGRNICARHSESRGLSSKEICISIRHALAWPTQRIPDAKAAAQSTPGNATSGGTLNSARALTASCSCPEGYWSCSGSRSNVCRGMVGGITPGPWGIGSEHGTPFAARIRERRDALRWR